MPQRTRAAAILATVLALIVYAYAPLVRAGFLGEDLAVLTSLEESTRPLRPAGGYRVVGTDQRPGAVLSLVASRALWTPGLWQGDEAPLLRLENLLLLGLAAFGLVGGLRRALDPWAGRDLARAAGHAGAAFVLVHPLAVSAVARLSARGDLCALALSAWAVQAFLLGRQERVRPAVVLAWVLAVLAGFCSSLALYLPLVLAALEHQSARRLRPLGVRWRTTITTLLVFAAAVLVEALPRSLLAPAGGASLFPLPPAASPGLWLERLGVLLMPGNVHGLGPSAPLLGGLATLIALHPALVAVRSAPRLWGRLLLAWGIALGVAVAPGAYVRVTPEGLAGAPLLLPAAVVMAVGLGTAATAISGWRRTFVPVAVGALFALLGRAQAVPLGEAAEAVRSVREDLVAAASERSWSGNLILIDPPREVAGLDALGADPGLLLTPALPPYGRAGGIGVRALDRRAFEIASRGEGFSALRASGVSLVLPADLLEPHSSGRSSLPLPPPGPENARVAWVGEGKSPPGVLVDPLRSRYLRVTALPDADTSRPPLVRWTTDRWSEDAGLEGVWVVGGDAPVAVFDLERSTSWWLAGRVRSLWMDRGIVQITTAELEPGPVEFGPVVGHIEGVDWIFEPAGTRPRVKDEVPTWVLEFYDPQAGWTRELSARSEPGGRVRFVGAGRLGGGEVQWSLELRAGSVTLTRTSKAVWE